MKEEYKKELICCGVNFDDAMVRLINSEDIYESLLNMFLEDMSYSDFAKAYETKDVDECFKAAHTLKGVASNLSFDSINKIINPIVEELRKGEFRINEVTMTELSDRYNEIINIIQKYSMGTEMQ